MVRGLKKLLLPLFVFAIFFAFAIPFLSLILWSVGKDWSWPKLLPAEFTGQFWTYLFDTYSKTGESVTTSILLAGVVTLIVIVISIPAGRILALEEFKGKNLIETLIFLPIIVPPIAVVMGIHLIFIRMGFADTFFGVVLAHLIPTTSYMVRILKTVFTVLGRKMEEQADALGANGWQTFWHVTFPMIIPGVITGGILVFLISLGQYLLTFLIGGGRVVTLPLVLFPYVTSGNRPMAAVLSILFTVPGIFVILITEFWLKRRYQDIDLYFV